MLRGAEHRTAQPARGRRGCAPSVLTWAGAPDTWTLDARLRLSPERLFDLVATPEPSARHAQDRSKCVPARRDAGARDER